MAEVREALAQRDLEIGTEGTEADSSGGDDEVASGGDDDLTRGLAEIDALCRSEGVEAELLVLVEGLVSRPIADHLDERGIVTLADLVAAGPAALLALPWVGPKRAGGIVAELRRALTTRGLLPPPAESKPDASPLQHLGTIAGWALAERGVRTLAQALDLLAQGEDVPAEVARAWKRLGDTPLEVIGGDDAGRFDPLRAMRTFLEGLDARRRAILVRRVVPFGPDETLQELADEFGNTRERVRQVELQVKARLETLRTDPSSPLVRAAQRLARQIGPAMPVAHAERLAQPLVGRAETDEAPIFTALLLWLGGPYKLDQGWLVREPVEETLARAMDSIDEALGEDGLPLPAVLDSIEGLGFDRSVASAWLERLGGYRAVDGIVIKWRGSLVDRAATVLRMVGEPMTREQLASAIPEGTSDRSLWGRLLQDSRFMRTSPRHVALREWGVEEYSNITDEIVQEIERQGGETTIGHLVAALSKFGVAESSVRAYLARPFFVRTERRTIRVSEQLVTAGASRPIELARWCFRHPTGWSYRIEVDENHLRGSGSPLAAAFGGQLGLSEMATRSLPSDFGEILFSWLATRPTIGSIRRILDAFAAVEGDLLFLTYSGQRGVSFRIIRRRDLDATSGLGRLALEMGLDPETDTSTPGPFLRALGFPDHGNGSFDMVRDRLMERGERQLAALLRSP